LAFQPESKISGWDVFGFIPAKEEVLCRCRGLLRRRETARSQHHIEMGAKRVKSHSLLTFRIHLAANPGKVLFFASLQEDSELRGELMGKGVST
jgi:hypothetical protein